MTVFLNFGGTCTYNLKNTKTMRDKLHLINVMRYVRNSNNYN